MFERKGTRLKYTERTSYTPAPANEYWRPWLDACAKLNPFDTEASLIGLLKLDGGVPPEGVGEYLNLIGIALSNPKNPRYDEFEAQLYFKRAVAFGSASAAHNLGRSYLSGVHGKIDYDKALHWYEHAYKLGHPTASTALLALKQRGARFKRDPAFAAAAWEAVAIDAARDAPTAMLAIAHERPRENPTLTIQYLEKLAAGDANGRLLARPNLTGAFHAGLTYFLGFNAPEDWSKARYHLNRAVAATAGRSEWETYRNCATETLATMKQLGCGTPNIAEIVRRVYIGDYSAEKLFHDIVDRDASVSEELAARVCAAHMLNGNERNGLYGWNRILSAIDARLVGSDLRRLEVQQITAYGPFYNEMPAASMPRLGVLKHGGLTNGVGELAQIKGTANGNIEFSFRGARKDIGPLLSQEDINVALALTFSGDKPQDAWVTVDTLYSPTARPRETSARRWGPEWLGHTAIGATLYGVDVLAARLAFSPEEFLDEPKLPAAAKRLLEDLKMRGGEETGSAVRTVVYADNFYRTWRIEQDGSHACDIHKLIMRIGGANVVGNDTNVNFNHDRFAAGRGANILTREYDTLAKLMPAFERFRQITALLQGLKQLRERGFEPNIDVRNSVSRTIKHYAMKPKLSVAERLVL
jgi:hypothetical protein